jgi:hypothetical protein
MQVSGYELPGNSIFEPVRKTPRGCKLQPYESKERGQNPLIVPFMPAKSATKTPLSTFSDGFSKK